MFDRKLLLVSLVALLGIAQVRCIVSKPDSTNQDSGTSADVNKQDNVAAQSQIDRDYSYDDHYDHGGGGGGGYGLGAHASYGFPEGYGGDNYGGYEGGKQHGHHLEDHHHHLHGHHHKHHDYGYHKALAIKGLLVPLAGVALLGAAAAFVSNPILLQLGVISGAPLGRRRRETKTDSGVQEVGISQENQIRLKEIKLLERFMAQVPKEEILRQERKILASYLSCSGATTTENLCLERLACELHTPEGLAMSMEANVFNIVVDEILHNDFVPTEKKKRISDAIQRGKNDSRCFVYKCEALENHNAFNSNLNKTSQKKNKKKVVFETETTMASDLLPR